MTDREIHAERGWNAFIKGNLWLIAASHSEMSTIGVCVSIVFAVIGYMTVITVLIHRRAGHSAL